MNRGELHSKLKARVQRAVSELPDAFLLNNVQGYDEQLRYKYGLGKGTPDLVGIGPGGKFLGIEIKTGHATQTKEQKAWQKLIRQYKGESIVVRAETEADIEAAVSFAVEHVASLRTGDSAAADARTTSL